MKVGEKTSKPTITKILEEHLKMKERTLIRIKGKKKIKIHCSEKIRN